MDLPLFMSDDGDETLDDAYQPSAMFNDDATSRLLQAPQQSRDVETSTLDFQNLQKHIERLADVGSKLQDLHRRLDNRARFLSHEISDLQKRYPKLVFPREFVFEEPDLPIVKRDRNHRRDAGLKIDKALLKKSYKWRNQLSGLQILREHVETWTRNIEYRSAKCIDMMPKAPVCRGYVEFDKIDEIDEPVFDQALVADEMRSGSIEMDQLEDVYKMMPSSI